MTQAFFNPYVKNYVLPFIGGILYASAFPFYEDSSFVLGGFLGMFFLLNNFGYQSFQAPTFRYEILSVICFSLGHYLFGHYWIAHTLNIFGQVPFPFNHLLGLFFSLIILPHFLVFTGLNFLTKKISFNSNVFISGPTRRSLTFALIFTLLEYFIPQQFPAHLGHTWLPLAPYLGLAPVFGAPIFSFMSYWLILSVIQMLRLQKLNLFPILTFIAFVVLNATLPLQDQRDGLQSLNIRMVQANIGNYLKLRSEAGRPQALTEVLEVFEKLSTQEFTKSDKGIDLIIWPETAYPRLLSSSSMKGTTLFTPPLIMRTLKDQDAEIFFGGYDQVPNRRHPNFFETEYNSAFMLNKSGNLKDVYHKQILIPFGESLPFGPLNEFFNTYLNNVSFFAKGESYTSFETKSGHHFISAICYEILFSGHIRKYLNQQKSLPHFLVNLTNDSWYGDTSEPYQHLFLAKWRALEFNLPILRMTNTGITSVIYPDGSESRRLLPFEKGVLDIVLKLKDSPKTWFQHIGVWGTLLVAIMLLMLSYLIQGDQVKSEKNLP